jgi:catechol 2,3-dioxygenase
MASDPLDLRAILAEGQTSGEADTRLPEGTRLGHMHLQVADLGQARAFYEGVLGFEMVVDWSRQGALFVSAGGYHHHLGLNVWRSRNGGPPAPGSAGLRFFTIHLPDAESLAPVQARLDAAGVAQQPEDGGLTFADPWGNGIRLLVGSTLPAEAAVPVTA